MNSFENKSFNKTLNFSQTKQKSTILSQRSTPNLFLTSNYPFIDVKGKTFYSDDMKKIENDLKSIKIKIKDQKEIKSGEAHCHFLKDQFDEKKLNIFRVSSKGRNSISSLKSNFERNSIKHSTRSKHSFKQDPDFFNVIINNFNENENKLSNQLKVNMKKDLSNLFNLKDFKSRNKEGLRAFISTIKSRSQIICAQKYGEEQLIRNKETMLNEVEQLKEDRYNMKYAIEKFENDYLPHLSQLILKLSQEKEDILKEMSLMENTRYKLEIEIRLLRVKIQKLNEKIELEEEYKYFLMCVKDKKFFSKKDIVINRRRSILNPFKKLEKKTISSKELKESVKKLNFLEKWENNKIFQDVNEFMNEIRILERESIELLNIEQKKKDKLKINELRIGQKEEIVDQDLENLIVKKEYLLKNLKEKNKTLKEKISILKVNPKKSIVKSYSFVGTTSTLQGIKQKNQTFNGKINSLYCICRDFTKLENQNDERNDRQNKIEKNLKIIEIAVNLLLQKYQFIEEKFPDELKKIEKVLEFERKVQYYEQQKQQSESKKEKLIEKMNKKNNKQCLIPKRKIGFRICPKDKNKKLVEEKFEEQLTFTQLISFEDVKNDY